MRIIAGGIMHETHAFSVEPTTAETLPIHRGEACWRYAGANHSLGGVLDGCTERGIEVEPVMLVDGVSTGTPSRETFDALLGELVERIEAALPADGIVLTLHGAMVAEGYPDAEAEIVRRVRALVGPETPIAVTLDFHANIGQGMVDEADIVTTYDTYPHIDAGERAKEAVGLIARVIRGEIKPTMALVKPPLLPVPQAQFTAKPPFKTIFDRAFAMEVSGEALTVTVSGGFAYADVPDAGVSLLVTTDNDPAAARRLATELAEMAWAMREQMIVTNTPPAEAVAEAIAYPEGPVMLVDVGDNIGGGTPGDGTVLLAELIRQDAREATMVIADAEAVQQAIAAGVRNTVRLRVGGKTDRLHGDPVEVEGRVRLISDGRWVHEGPENAGVPVEMGPTVVLRCGGVNLVLTTQKSMPGDQQQLKSVGIRPEQQKIIVVKAAVRWRGGYQAIAKHAIHVDTPGLGSVDLSRFDYHAIRRPIFPLDPETTWSPA
ncbi:MAG: M81 family metallopeptidase [Thermomicrobiales bacterium]|nr:M81 family metallopeptidase [Thermomicrobiales bacterium]